MSPVLHICLGAAVIDLAFSCPFSLCLDLRTYSHCSMRALRERRSLLSTFREAARMHRCAFTRTDGLMAQMHPGTQISTYLVLPQRSHLDRLYSKQQQSSHSGFCGNFSLIPQNYIIYFFKTYVFNNLHNVETRIMIPWLGQLPYSLDWIF